MKKIIIIIVLLLSIGVYAQPPKTFYTTKERTSFNPYSTYPIINIYTCFSTFKYNYDTMTIIDCNDKHYQFELITPWDYNIEKKYCSCWMKEPSSGTNWSMIYYYDEVTLTMLAEDKSLLLIYY